VFGLKPLGAPKLPFAAVLAQFAVPELTYTTEMVVV
jgi:hypothetical protein